MNSKYTNLSKNLSYMLRHNPKTPMDEHGYVKLSYVCEKLHCTLEDIKYIMKTSKEETGKVRFEITDDSIRACYGHSNTAVEIQYEEYTPEESYLYHGTAAQNKPLINSEGIKSMTRQKVCLSTEKQTAIRVANRHSGSIYIYTVDVKKAMELGVKFYKGNDTTVLSDNIPPEAIE